MKKFSSNKKASIDAKNALNIHFNGYQEGGAYLLQTQIMDSWRPECQLVIPVNT